MTPVPIASAPATRAERNIANAQFSTGPRSKSGKSRVSLNATKHGLSGESILLSTESAEQFEAALARFADLYQPQGQHEERLVGTIRDCHWRLDRIVRLEANLTSIAVKKAIEQLTGGAEPDDATQSLAEAQAYFELKPDFAQFGRHESRIERKLLKAEKQLAEMQAARLGDTEQPKAKSQATLQPVREIPVPDDLDMPRTVEESKQQLAPEVRAALGIVHQTRQGGLPAHLADQPRIVPFHKISNTAQSLAAMDRYHAAVELLEAAKREFDAELDADPAADRAANSTPEPVE